jgi:hypothetical protein
LKVGLLGVLELLLVLKLSLHKRLLLLGRETGWPVEGELLLASRRSLRG